MKKIITMSMFALGTMVSFAGNTEKCSEDSFCQVLGRYYEIRVEEWYFPGGGVFPYTATIYSEKGWFTLSQLEARKTLLKSQYTDSYTNGTGSKYQVFSSLSTPPIVPWP